MKLFLEFVQSFTGNAIILGLFVLVFSVIRPASAEPIMFVGAIMFGVLAFAHSMWNDYI